LFEIGVKKMNGISDYNSYESHAEACYYSEIIESYQNFVDNVGQLLCIKNTRGSELGMTDELEDRIYSRIKFFISKSMGDK
jgi:hypothetical protein